MTTVVHSIIVQTAKEIAAEAYEDMAKENQFYAEWPCRSAFVNKNWRMFVDHARKALLSILAGEYPEAMKAPIYEAMIIDGSMKRVNQTLN